MIDTIVAVHVVFSGAYRPIVIWMVNFLSSSSVFEMRADSALTLGLMAKFRLIRIFFDLKPTYDPPAQLHDRRDEGKRLPEFKSYWSFSLLIRIPASTRVARACISSSLLIAVAVTSSSNVNVS